MSVASASTAETIPDRVFRILTDGKGGMRRRIEALPIGPLDADEARRLFATMGAMARRIEALEGQLGDARRMLESAAQDAATVAASAASLAQAAEWMRRSIDI